MVIMCAPQPLVPRVRDAGDESFERITAVASGERTASEELDVGQEEFISWQFGTVI
jgi:altronate hydrolase